MQPTNFDRLNAYIGQRYPHFRRGVDESVAISPQRFADIADMYLGWLLLARGDDAEAGFRTERDPVLSEAIRLLERARTQGDLFRTIDNGSSDTSARRN